MPKRPLIPAVSFPVMAEADSVDQLMVHWLQELHLAFDMRRLVLTHFWIDEISRTHIEGGGKGMKFDETRHKLGAQIKAVTYHHLKVQEQNGIWIAEVIFDI